MRSDWPWFSVDRGITLKLTTGVSVLSQDVTVEAAGMDTQFLRHGVTEAGGVQVGAAANDTVLWKATQFPGNIGQNIHCRTDNPVYFKYHTINSFSNMLVCNNTFHSFLWFSIANVTSEKVLRSCANLLTWIGHDNDDTVRAEFDNLRDDVFKYVDVPLHQVQSALPLLLTHTGRHHDNARVGSHGVVYRSKKSKKMIAFDFMQCCTIQTAYDKVPQM